MRVLVLNWRDMKNPRAGGAEVVTDNILRGLADMGHDVTLFTSEFSGARTYEDVGYARIIRSGSVKTVYVHAFLYFLRHSSEFDFVIESVSAVPFFTPLYFNSRRTVIIPHHLVGRVIFKELGLPSAVPAFVAEKLIPYFYRGSNFIAVSESVRKELIDSGVDPRRISVCLFGTHLLFVPARLPKYRTPTVLALSRLKRYKRIDLILSAFKRVLEKVNARLIVVGSGEESQRLKQYAARLGINKAVRFVGHVSEKTKSELLSRSWVFATASEREGFGIGALEAEMSSTPVVAFNAGGLKEAVMNNYSGFIVDEGDEEKFAERLVSLLSNKRLMASMSHNAARYGTKFDSKRAIAKIDELMRKNQRGKR